MVWNLATYDIFTTCIKVFLHHTVCKTRQTATLWSSTYCQNLNVEYKRPSAFTAIKTYSSAYQRHCNKYKAIAERYLSWPDKRRTIKAEVWACTAKETTIETIREHIGDQKNKDCLLFSLCISGWNPGFISQTQLLCDANGGPCSVASEQSLKSGPNKELILKQIGTLVVN